MLWWLLFGLGDLSLPKLLSFLAGLPSFLPLQEDLVLQPMLASASPQSGESSSLTLAAFREKGKQAGLSARAAEFSAEALRESTRCYLRFQIGMLLYVV